MKAFLFTAAFVLSSSAPAWDGYDWDRGSYVEIGRGNLVRPGREIEVYNWGSGGYKNYEVDSIRNSGTRVEVEVYDWDTGEYRVFDMD